MRLVRYLRRKQHEHHAKKAKESGADVAARRTAIATIAIAVLTFAIAATSVLQWIVFNRQLDVMQGQLGEMKATGKQTDDAIAATSRLVDQAAKSATAASQLAQAASDTATANRILADETHKLVENSAKSNAAAQRMVDTASKANAVAADLVETTRQANETAKNVQRAFVLPRGIELVKVSGPARLTGDITGTTPFAWQAFVQWENSGNTPARDFTVHSSCAFGDWPTPVSDPSKLTIDDPKLQFIMKNRDVSVLIGPKQTVDAGYCVVHGLGVMLQQFGEMQDFLFGEATYKDILNPTYTHRTQFCFQLRLSGSWAGSIDDAVPLAVDGRPCEKHNCADEECDAQ